MGGLTQGPFSAIDVDMVPYDVELEDSNGAVEGVPAGGVITLTSNDGNSIVVPNSSDPTGATGNILCAAGFAGAVSGAASFQGPADPVTGVVPDPITGTWSGVFTPGQPASIAVEFGAPVPNAPAAPAAAAKPSGFARK
jgi:hypothetical protein